MVTLDDVARLAGVTGATVSNVINNKGTVSEKTREKVEAAILQLGYQPNLIARGLAHGQTKILALVVNTIANPFYAEFAEEVQLAAWKHKQYLLLYSTRQMDREAPQHGLRQLYSLVDGLLVTEDALSTTEVEWAAQTGVQVVLCFGWKPDKTVQAFPSVYYDHFQASALAADHLWQLGHRDCAIIVQTPQHERRLEGFRAELASHDVFLREECIQRSTYATIREGYMAAQSLLALPTRPTAIFTSNDLLAIGAMDAILDNGLHVPQDISVVGFDDIQLASEVRPSLTTVALARKELAVKAVDLLIQNVVNQEPMSSVPHLVVRPHLVTRQSTAQPPMPA